jgi:hypothetical protein
VRFVHVAIARLLAAAPAFPLRRRIRTCNLHDIQCSRLELRNCIDGCAAALAVDFTDIPNLARMPITLATANFASTTFGRDLDLSQSLVVLTALQSAFFAYIVLLAARFGSPRTWPMRVVVVVVLLAVGASVIWWWVDKDVEGSVLLSFSRSHGVTTGDLLSVPMLVTAAMVVACAATGARRSHQERP